jgi:hypothetical protein
MKDKRWIKVNLRLNNEAGSWYMKCPGCNHLIPFKPNGTIQVNGEDTPIEGLYTPLRRCDNLECKWSTAAL